MVLALLVQFNYNGSVVEIACALSGLGMQMSKKFEKNSKIFYNILYYLYCK